MTETVEDRGWKYYFFKKRYPAWLYTIVLALSVALIYIWFRSAVGM